MKKQDYIDFIEQIGQELREVTFPPAWASRLAADIDEFLLVAEEKQQTNTGKGTREALERFGVNPTGNSYEDINLLRELIRMGKEK